MYWRRLLGSGWSLLIAALLIGSYWFATFVYFEPDNELSEKIYDIFDINIPYAFDSSVQWAATFYNDYFFFIKWGIVALGLIWFVHAIFGSMQPKKIRFVWWIFFIVTLLYTSIIALLFLSIGAPDDIFKVYLYLYMAIVPLLIFVLYTLTGHNELKNANPIRGAFKK